MKRFSGIALSVAACSLATQAAVAQTKLDTTKVQNLNEVVVKAVRASKDAPYAVANLKKAELQQFSRTGLELPFLLSRTPGILAWGENGIGTGTSYMRIRGAAGSRINVTLDGVMDVYLPDLKHRSEKMGQLCAKASNYFAAASAAITEMVRQTGTPVYDENGIMKRGTLIRHLILPGLTSESCQLLDWVKENLPEGVPVSLMRQYIPCNNVSIPGLTRTITNREYIRVRDHMLDLGLPGYLQEPESASEDFVPVFCKDESFV